MAVAVVNCGDYTDVCEAFSIHQFPTIKYRLGIHDGYILFKLEHVFFSGLVKILTGLLMKE